MRSHIARITSIAQSLDGEVFINYQTGLAKQMTLTTIKRLKRQGAWD